MKAGSEEIGLGLQTACEVGCGGEVRRGDFEPGGEESARATHLERLGLG